MLSVGRAKAFEAAAVMSRASLRFVARSAIFGPSMVIAGTSDSFSRTFRKSHCTTG